MAKLREKRTHFKHIKHAEKPAQGKPSSDFVAMPKL